MPLTDHPALVDIDEASAGQPAPVSDWEKFQSARKVEEQGKEDTADVPFKELLSRSIGIDWIYPQIQEATRRHGFPVDPSWQLPDTFQQDLDGNGLGPEFAEEFENVFSQEEYDFLMRRFSAREDEKQFVANAGGRGLAARLLAGVSDPVSLAVDAATGPLAFVKGAGRLSNAIRGGLTAGTVNAGITGLQSVSDPTINGQNLLIDFAAGAVLGGGLGAITGGRTAADGAEYAEDVRRAINKDTSAGAAQVRGVQPEDGLDINIGNQESAAFQGLVDEAFAEADTRAFFTTGAGRFLRRDIASQLEKSKDPIVRKLKRILIPEPVGFKGDEAVNSFAATEQALRLQQRTEEVFRRDYEDSLRKFLGDDAGANRRRVFSIKERDEFAKRVGAAVRGADEVDGNILSAARAVQKHFKDMADELKRAGVKGADHFDYNPRYMPRVASGETLEHIRGVLKDQPEADTTITKLISKGIRSALAKKGKDIDEALTDKVADHYMKGYLKGSFSGGKQNRLSSVNEGYLEDVLETAGLEDDAIEGILDQFRVNDGGEASGADFNRLKSRLDMDENVSVVLANGEELFLRDLFDSNVDRVVNHYTREASGRVALADAGFKSEREFDEVLEQLADSHRTGGHVTPDEIDTLNFLKNHLLGRSLENDPSGLWAQAGRTVRDQNFLNVMGSVGFSMLAEFGSTIGYAGFRATLRQVPAMGKILKQAIRGELPDELARELSSLAAPGSSMLRNPVNIRPEELGFHGFDRGKLWRKLDNGMQIAKKAQTIASGLGPLNDLMQINASRAMSQRLYHLATKGASKAQRARLRDYGLSNEMQNKLFRHLRDNAEVDSWGTLKSVGMDAMDDDVREAVSGALFRATRHIIQEQDIGTTFRFMHSTFGKVATQFRTFMIASYTRHTLHGMARHDKAAFVTMMTSTFFASLGYMARIQLAYANDEKRRRELLSVERIGKSAFQASTQASIIPMVIDYMGTLSGNDPVFGYAGRSTGLETGAILGNPTVATYLKAMKAGQIPLTILNPSEEVTKEHVEAAGKLIWLSNIAGARSLIREVGDQFPSEFQ